MQFDSCLEDERITFLARALQKDPLNTDYIKIPD